MLHIELRALRDPLLGQEAVVILPPRRHFFGGPGHGFDDFGLRLAFAQQRQHLFLLQLVACHYIVHERDDLRALEIELRMLHVPVPRTRGCGEQQRKDCETDRLTGSHYELTNFLCEYSAIRIPKPASRVTTEVPP